MEEVLSAVGSHRAQQPSPAELQYVFSYNKPPPPVKSELVSYTFTIPPARVPSGASSPARVTTPAQGDCEMTLVTQVNGHRQAADHNGQHSRCENEHTVAAKSEVRHLDTSDTYSSGCDKHSTGITESHTGTGSTPANPPASSQAMTLQGHPHQRSAGSHRPPLPPKPKDIKVAKGNPKVARPGVGPPKRRNGTSTMPCLDTLQNCSVVLPAELVHQQQECSGGDADPSSMDPFVPHSMSSTTPSKDRPPSPVLPQKPSTSPASSHSSPVTNHSSASNSPKTSRSLTPSSSPSQASSPASTTSPPGGSSSPRLTRHAPARAPKSPITQRRPSLTPIRESTRECSSPNVTEGDTSPTYLDRLKTLTEKLKLSPRRPSIMEWKARQASDRRRIMLQQRQRREEVECGTTTTPQCLCVPPPLPGYCHCAPRTSSWSPAVKNRIDGALSWLRAELVSMREQDQELARTLVSLRQDLHAVKLARSSAEHRELLEDAMEAEEERGDELHGPAGQIYDEPLSEVLSPTLKNCGLTRMNITARRFSVF